MNIETFISDAVRRSVEALYGELSGEQLQIQKTRREFEGDYTLVTFPLLRRSRKSPEATATEIGEYMTAHVPEIASFNVIKGFLNLSLDGAFWAARFEEIAADEHFGQAAPTGRTVMIEYSSPNTNKPLHLGHIRNNLLGYSVAQILAANGHTVIKANLVNDRGIHICKSMLAWKRYGGGETPASSGMKGDHLVGKYYVEFDKHYKAQVKELTASGMSEEEAKKRAPLMLEAQEMLRRWEARDPEVYGLWEMMNGWVYGGFDVTYKALGVDFDKVYYESQTYLLGKDIVQKGLDMGIFYRREDGSVWIDLTADGLDQKLLLRGDGTSVYMTQDLGTAYRRFEDNKLDDMIYVVGNEQNYHFQVLKLVLKKLGYADWSDHITHLSYGMVELPEGKMKSREGTVVDADDLIQEEEMVVTLTHHGYIKRTASDHYRAQRRGGRGITALSTKEEDFAEDVFATSTHSYLLFFTTKGKVYMKKCYQIPEAGRTAKGMAIVNLLALESEEKVSAVFPIEKFEDDSNLVMVTRQGIIKKTQMSAFSRIRQNLSCQSISDF